MAKKPKDLTAIALDLPKDLRLFVAERARDRYGSASEYVCELIREDQQRSDQSLNDKLLQALDSGPGVEVTPAFWEALRRRIRRRARAGKKA